MVDDPVVHHYWIGDAADGQHVDAHIVCWSPETKEEAMETGIIHVTMIIDDVTCQRCLEWIHA